MNREGKEERGRQLSGRFPHEKESKRRRKEGKKKKKSPV